MLPLLTGWARAAPEDLIKQRAFVIHNAASKIVRSRRLFSRWLVMKFELVDDIVRRHAYVASQARAIL